MKRRKLLSMLLTVIMALSLIPATVMADDTSSVDIQLNTVTEETVKENSESDSDTLFAGYVNRQFGIEDENSAPSTKKRGAPARIGDQLKGNDKAVYDTVLAAVQDILAGVRTNTTIEVYNTSIDYTLEELGYTEFSQEAVDFAAACELEKASFDLSKVVHALLNDYPYEMFWYDKATGASNSSVPTAWTLSSKGVVVGIRIQVVVTISFSVLKDYSASGKSGTYELGDVMTSINSAVANAQAVVRDAASLSDIEKLTAYKDTICDYTSYNSAAAAAGGSINFGSGNPWQLIWVFDGNPNTNVVCEGYAKAYKYLCDLTDFESDLINCYLVSGRMYKDNETGEGHMWNIVTLDSATYYIVDVTNCDTGTIGAPDLLFLRGYDVKQNITLALSNGSQYSTTEYGFWISSHTVYYYYDYNTENTYSYNHKILEVEPAGEEQINVSFRHSCSFQNTFAINYYVKASDLEGYSNIYLEVAGGPESKTLNGRLCQLSGESYYRFQYSGIYASYMSRSLTAIVHATKDGVEY